MSRSVCRAVCQVPVGMSLISPFAILIAQSTYLPVFSCAAKIRSYLWRSFSPDLLPGISKASPERALAPLQFCWARPGPDIGRPEPGIEKIHQPQRIYQWEWKWI